MCYDIIKDYEGFSENAYKCPAGVWTYGYGSTIKADGTPVKQGDTITKQGAEALLTDYIIKNVYPVFSKIPYTLTSNQKEAIASLCYNVGVPSFLKSKCFKAMCNKQWVEMVKNWDWGYSQNLKGLIKRRANEIYLFTRDI